MSQQLSSTLEEWLAEFRKFASQGGRSRMCRESVE